MKKVLINGIVFAGSLLLFAGVASAATVVVTPSNMQGWAFVNDQTNTPTPGTGMMVEGPGTPPLGVGSAQLTTANTSDGQILAMAGSTYADVPLSELTTLTYYTYQSPSNTSTATAISLQFDVVSDVTATYPGYEGRIVYEPYNNSGGTVPLGTWTQWDALNGGNGEWWFSHPSDFSNVSCPQATPCTLSAIEAAYPHIGINPDGAVVLKAGSNWAPFSGNVDDLTIGVSGVNTTYDFDPSPSVTTNPASDVTASDATLSGTDGAIDAGGDSFWVSTSPINTSSPNIPAGVYSTPEMGAVTAGTTFTATLSSITSDGVPGDLPTIQPNTTYYYVAWVNVGGTWYPGAQQSFTTLNGAAPPTPGVTTNSATGETLTDATLNGTNGPVAADQESFWVSTSMIDTSSPNIPAGVYSTPVLPGVGAGASFSDPLSLVTTEGITYGQVPGNMPAITPGQTYYFVAWSHVNGTWYPGQMLSLIMPLAAAQCPEGTVQSATPVGTDVINSGSSTATLGTNDLSSGQPYLLEVSGTWTNTGGYNVADAMYASFDGAWATYQEGQDATPYFLGPNEFNLEVDNQFVNWGPYDGTSHTYTDFYTGTGGPVSFLVFDGNSNDGPVAGVDPSWYGDNTGNLTVNVYSCNVPTPTTGSISGTVFNDKNRDQTQDNGEPGLKGWTVNLETTGHTVIETTTTDANGNYSFTNVAPGTYDVRESPEIGWTRTTLNPETIVLTAGDDVTDVDFGDATLRKGDHQDTWQDCQRDDQNGYYYGNRGWSDYGKDWNNKSHQQPGNYGQQGGNNNNNQQGGGNNNH